ncbi:hypothetical protein SKAU_G00418690 [Synaphobranchus kaupii]|uniref:Uncharacterized protein n=1 Tax=Synaphobranchus kaupii TaxID=118154 RepID=A0A9Q1E650_SYNKA|nr:hypothetical protein SKAU_G00418690 [Synaphobranchus kaupii]
MCSSADDLLKQEVTARCLCISLTQKHDWHCEIHPHWLPAASLSTQTQVNPREGEGDGGVLCEFELLCCSPLSQTPPKSHMDPQAE